METPKSQKVQKLLSQNARNQIQVLNLHHRQKQVHNRNPVRHLINRCQDKQTRKNKPSTNTKPTNDKHMSDRMRKGPDDPVKLHSQFGAFEEVGETPRRSSARNSLHI